MFIDQVRVSLKAGKGGNGCVSFRREAYVPKGGPDGGRGGNGGSVMFFSDRGVGSLVYFRFHPILKAKNGAPGEGGRRQGKRGADNRLAVPPGTVVKDEATGEVLFDFTGPDMEFTAAKGGRGGRGNSTYATSTHQAPREFQPGTPGEEKELVLELKLIADVGLVGFPNAGKSTLISRISAARPVIADYLFTTLIPNLGVVDIDENRSFIVADIPGIIEGAHQGHGLGLQFLRHIERTKVLAHLVDVSPYSGRDPVEDFKVIMKELASFKPDLSGRPQIVVANKTDLLVSAADKERLAALKDLAASKGLPFMAVSAMSGEGLPALVKVMLAELDRAAGEKKEDGGRA